MTVPGKFPERWMYSELVFIPKPREKDATSASAYRHICLTREVGKILEKIIVERISQHLEHIGPNISEKQFGFRKVDLLLMRLTPL